MIDRAELIGEEIYDEFDDQGAHGDPYEVPPAPALTQPAEQDTTEVVPVANVNQNTLSSRPPSISQRPGTSGSGQSYSQRLTPSIQMPVALKGLGFFRTRSAPPVPHDASEADTSGRSGYTDVREKTVRIGEGANTEIPRPLAHSPTSAAAGASILMPRPIRGSRNPPSVILEQHSSVSSSNSDVLSSLSMAAATDTLQAPTADNRPTVPLPGTVGLSASVGATPKSPSPAPSPALEAILLDRKRRLHAANVGAGTVHSAPTTPPVAPTGGAGTALNTPGSPLGMGAATLGVPRESSAAPSISPAPSAASGGTTAAGSGSGKGTAGAAKGTRFKSSPLGGIDRAGVVVAEQVHAAYHEGNKVTGGRADADPK